MAGPNRNAPLKKAPPKPPGAFIGGNAALALQGDSPFSGISNTHAPARNTHTPHLTAKVQLAKLRREKLKNGGLLTPEQQSMERVAKAVLKTPPDKLKQGPPAPPPPDRLASVRKPPKPDEFIEIGAPSAGLSKFIPPPKPTGKEPWKAGVTGESILEKYVNPVVKKAAGAVGHAASRDAGIVGDVKDAVSPYTPLDGLGDAAGALPDAWRAVRPFTPHTAVSTVKDAPKKPVAKGLDAASVGAGTGLEAIGAIPGTAFQAPNIKSSGPSGKLGAQQTAIEKVKPTHFVPAERDLTKRWLEAGMAAGKKIKGAGEHSVSVNVQLVGKSIAGQFPGQRTITEEQLRELEAQKGGLGGVPADTRHTWIEGAVRIGWNRADVIKMVDSDLLHAYGNPPANPAIQFAKNFGDFGTSQAMVPAGVVATADAAAQAARGNSEPLAHIGQVFGEGMLATLPQSLGGDRPFWSNLYWHPGETIQTAALGVGGIDRAAGRLAGAAGKAAMTPRMIVPEGFPSPVSRGHYSHRPIARGIQKTQDKWVDSRNPVTSNIPIVGGKARRRSAVKQAMFDTTERAYGPVMTHAAELQVGVLHAAQKIGADRVRLLNSYLQGSDPLERAAFYHEISETIAKRGGSRKERRAAEAHVKTSDEFMRNPLLSEDDQAYVNAARAAATFATDTRVGAGQFSADLAARYRIYQEPINIAARNGDPVAQELLEARRIWLGEAGKKQSSRNEPSMTNTQVETKLAEVERQIKQHERALARMGPRPRTGPNDRRGADEPHPRAPAEPAGTLRPRPTKAAARQREREERKAAGKAPSPFEAPPPLAKQPEVVEPVIAERNLPPKEAPVTKAPEGNPPIEPDDEMLLTSFKSERKAEAYAKDQGRAIVRPSTRGDGKFDVFISKSDNDAAATARRQEVKDSFARQVYGAEKMPKGADRDTRARGIDFQLSINHHLMDDLASDEKLAKAYISLNPKSAPDILAARAKLTGTARREQDKATGWDRETLDADRRAREPGKLRLTADERRFLKEKGIRISESGMTLEELEKARDAIRRAYDEKNWPKASKSLERKINAARLRSEAHHYDNLPADDKALGDPSAGPDELGHVIVYPKAYTTRKGAEYRAGQMHRESTAYHVEVYKEGDKWRVKKTRQLLDTDDEAAGEAAQAAFDAKMDAERAKLFEWLNGKMPPGADKAAVAARWEELQKRHVADVQAKQARRSQPEDQQQAKEPDKPRDHFAALMRISHEQDEKVPPPPKPKPGEPTPTYERPARPNTFGGKVESLGLFKTEAEAWAAAHKWTDDYQLNDPLEIHPYTEVKQRGSGAKKQYEAIGLQRKHSSEAENAAWDAEIEKRWGIKRDEPREDPVEAAKRGRAFEEEMRATLAAVHDARAAKTTKAKATPAKPKQDEPPPGYTIEQEKVPGSKRPLFLIYKEGASTYHEGKRVSRGGYDTHEEAVKAAWLDEAHPHGQGYDREGKPLPSNARKAPEKFNSPGQGVRWRAFTSEGKSVGPFKTRKEAVAAAAEADKKITRLAEVLEANEKAKARREANPQVPTQYEKGLGENPTKLQRAERGRRRVLSDKAIGTFKVGDDVMMRGSAGVVPGKVASIADNGDVTVDFPEHLGGKGTVVAPGDLEHNWIKEGLSGPHEREAPPTGPAPSKNVPQGTAEERRAAREAKIDEEHQADLAAWKKEKAIADRAAAKARGKKETHESRLRNLRGRADELRIRADQQVQEKGPDAASLKGDAAEAYSALLDDFIEAHGERATTTTPIYLPQEEPQPVTNRFRRPPKPQPNSKVPRMSATQDKRLNTGNYRTTAQGLNLEVMRAANVRARLDLADAVRDEYATKAVNGEPVDPDTVLVRADALGSTKDLTHTVGEHNMTDEMVVSSIRKMRERLEAGLMKKEELGGGGVDDVEGWVPEDGDYYVIPKSIYEELHDSLKIHTSWTALKHYDNLNRSYQRFMLSKPSTGVSNLVGNPILAMIGGASPLEATTGGYRLARHPEWLPPRLQEGGLAASLGQKPAGTYAGRYVNWSLSLQRSAEQAARAGLYHHFAGPHVKAEMRALGVDADTVLRRMADGKDPMGAQMARKVEHFLGTMGKSRRMHPDVDRFLGRSILFHRWLGHILTLTMYTLPIKYPGRAVLLQRIAEIGDDYRKHHGIYPAWYKGMLPLMQFMVGGDRYTRALPTSTIWPSANLPLPLVDEQGANPWAAAINSAQPVVRTLLQSPTGTDWANLRQFRDAKGDRLGPGLNLDLMLGQLWRNTPYASYLTPFAGKGDTAYPTSWTDRVNKNKYGKPLPPGYGSSAVPYGGNTPALTPQYGLGLVSRLALGGSGLQAVPAHTRGTEYQRVNNLQPTARRANAKLTAEAARERAKKKKASSGKP